MRAAPCLQHRGRAALQGRESRSESVTAFSRCGNDLSCRRGFQQPVKSCPPTTVPIPAFFRNPLERSAGVGGGRGGDVLISMRSERVTAWQHDGRRERTSKDKNANKQH